MALTKPVSLNDSRFGVAMPEAYIRVSAAEFNARNQMILTVDYYASKAVYDSGQFSPWKTARFVMEAFDQNAPGNVKTNVYGWLKTQSEFIGAGDI